VRSHQVHTTVQLAAQEFAYSDLDGSYGEQNIRVGVEFECDLHYFQLITSPRPFAATASTLAPMEVT